MLSYPRRPFFVLVFISALLWVFRNCKINGDSREPWSHRHHFLVFDMFCSLLVFIQDHFLSLRFNMVLQVGPLCMNVISVTLQVMDLLLELRGLKISVLEGAVKLSRQII